MPNALSLFRAACTPVIMAMLLSPLPSPVPVSLPFPAAAFLFGLAALTDGVDGYLARRQRRATALGSTLDLAADKLLVIGVLLALTITGSAPPWVVTVTVIREALVTGLRWRAARRGRPISTAWPGKLKAVLTYLAIGATILSLPGAGLLLTTSAALCVISATPYLRGAWQAP